MPKNEFTAWPLIATLALGTVLFLAFYIFVPEMVKQSLSATPSSSQGFPYQLNEPDKKYKLPDKLVEISGLSYLGDKQIACIQDEKGMIYRFNLKSEEAKKLFEFAKKGDYEGVEVIGNTAYILKSNGNLYEVTNLSLKDSATLKYTGFPLEGIDAEGLGWDPIFKRLLIAIKNNGSNGNAKLRNRRFVYSFDPATRKFSKGPNYAVNVKDLRRATGQPNVRFEPSGVAVHPVSGNIYLIASVGNLLVVLDRVTGKVKEVMDLPNKHFRQPEGICFNKSGDLYISNEGQNKQSNILKFDYRPSQN